MAKLNTEERKELSDKDFALPGRRYPIHDEAHARDALARASENATPAEQAEIKRKVHAKYPDMEIGGEKKGRGREARNKTPREAYEGGKKEERSEKKAEPKKEKKKETSGQRFIKHFSG